MAINQIQTSTPPDEVRTTKGKKGGSRTGQIIGGLIGGAAGAVAGTVAAPGAGTIAGGIAGAGGGASLGGSIGEMIAPSSQDSTAISRRIQAQAPQVIHSEQSEKLKQAILALHTQPPEIQQQYAPSLVNGYMTSIANDNKRTA